VAGITWAAGGIGDIRGRPEASGTRGRGENYMDAAEGGGYNEVDKHL